MPIHARRSPSRGLTLIELLVAIVIMGILLAVAMPGMRSLVVGQQLKTASFELTADLILARSEALKRNRSVNVTREGGDWKLGWTVGVTGGDAVNKRGVAGSDIVFENAPGSITFDANGRVSAPTDPVRITVKSNEASGNSRCIELDLSGRAKATRGACA